MATRAFDVIVVGGGPGGYVAAMRASQLGMTVALVEREALGGICVNWGCIPSKAILRSAEILRLIKHGEPFGVRVKDVEVDYAQALKRSNDTADKQNKGVTFLMRKYKVEVFNGNARLAANSTVRVEGGDGDTDLQANRGIILATGSRVKSIGGLQVDGDRIFSSREVWKMPDLPKSVLLLGGGAIGCEFATVFSAFGTKVTLVEALPRILPLEDPDSSAVVAREFKKKGIDVVTGMIVTKAEAGENGVQVRLEPTPPRQPVQVNAYGETPQVEQTGAKQAEPVEMEVDRVMLAAGFAPNSENLGLEELGVATERGFIGIDDHMQTNVPGIYAIGDVTGKLALAHVAEAQGSVAAEAIAGEVHFKLDYKFLPRAIFSDPQVASIGYTEEEARQQGIEYKVSTSPFMPNGKARAMGETAGQVKLLLSEPYGEIIGVHMVGPEATELIGEAVLARVLESTGLELGRAVRPHPTLSEVLAEAALEWAGMPIAG